MLFGNVKGKFPAEGIFGNWRGLGDSVRSRVTVGKGAEAEIEAMVEEQGRRVLARMFEFIRPSALGIEPESSIRAADDVVEAMAMAAGGIVFVLVFERDNRQPWCIDNTREGTGFPSQSSARICAIGIHRLSVSLLILFDGNHEIVVENIHTIGASDRALTDTRAFLMAASVA
ncbi:T-box transcription factor TBX21 [Striga asiatica]|uniref:T-box transcription factor TBX21 n=1 Tax=Striga asiatica TaxID=4170 RepID=A0A5A7QSM3_STRAF|nr:T-box transcription factor TBX21 [Striga asiatica]